MEQAVLKHTINRDAFRTVLHHLLRKGKGKNTRWFTRALYDKKVERFSEPSCLAQGNATIRVVNGRLHRRAGGHRDSSLLIPIEDVLPVLERLHSTAVSPRDERSLHKRVTADAMRALGMCMLPGAVCAFALLIPFGCRQEGWPTGLRCPCAESSSAAVRTVLQLLNMAQSLQPGARIAFRGVTSS